eukprot:gene13981-15439_t
MASEVCTESSSTINYPITVLYCGVCGVPPEYCEYGSEYEKCKKWLEDFNPDMLETMKTLTVGDEESGDKDGKKRQTRGGKANRQAKKKTAIQRVVISKEQRSKKKSVTIVVGLSTFEIDLKKAAKLFANKFSCGSSVTGEDEIVIQGDVSYDVVELIQNTWPEIDDDSIEDKT